MAELRWHPLIKDRNDRITQTEQAQMPKDCVLFAPVQGEYRMTMKYTSMITTFRLMLQPPVPDDGH